MGGHPAPSGRVLLRYNLAVPQGEDEFLTASMWGDLAQHLRRLWHGVDDLLLRQHARYEAVRSGDREHVDRAEVPWIERDPLAAPVDFRLLQEIVDAGGD